MEKQILLIHNFPVLYNIFFEIKDHLNFNLDRKILSEIAISDSAAFEKIVKTATG